MCVCVGTSGVMESLAPPAGPLNCCDSENRRAQKSAVSRRLVQAASSIQEKRDLEQSVTISKCHTYL